MASLSKRKALPMILLSIMVPISLLVTFRLTGVLREPPTLETITIDEVRWQMERPTKNTLIKEKVEKTYIDDAISIFATVSIHRYYENSLARPYNNRDGIAFRVDVNATAIQGFIASLVVKFFPLDVNATIYTGAFLGGYNTTVTYVKSIGTNTDTAYVEAKVSRSPCSLMVPAHWVFIDQTLENHQLRVNIEVTYSNETTHQTIVVPIVLKLLIVSI